ncbi:MAG: transposase [Planctomycetes bacterium]|nr:transposase [Planctomycetota bacterium]
MSTVPSTFQALFLQFAPFFTFASFQNFVTLTTGWILCTGRHTISRAIQFGMGSARDKHHSALYRFFSRAVWIPEHLGRRLFQLVLPLIPGNVVTALIDDTLCHRSGPHLWGGGMHYDAARSTYGRGTSAGRKMFFAFGHNWVILSLWVPMPWNPRRGLAVPVLFRLYRSKKRCPAEDYKKRTELAAEMVRIVVSWLPKDKELRLAADSEYACQTLLSDVSEQVEFVGPMPMDAAFYAPPGLVQPGTRGRHPMKGKRLPSPQELANDESVRWRHLTLPIYGREVSVMVKTQVGLWYHVTGSRLVRMIVTRDPSGRIEDRSYVSTNPHLPIEEIAQTFSRRWAQEVMHRDVKQSLGLEEPQNGWWRRPSGTRARKKRPGPQPHAHRGEKAVRHMVPFIFLVYTLIVLWYFKHGSAQKDVKRVRKAAPWYRHKQEPSFQDMLKAARLELWRGRISANPLLKRVGGKIAALFPLWLLTG